MLPVLLVAGLLAVPVSAAPDLFVATNGNDGNPGTQAQPLRSLQRAVALGSSTGSGNSWNLPAVPALASTDPAAITGARPTGGGIPSSPFLRPADGSALGARF